jgi:hypothetical protein
MRWVGTILSIAVFATLTATAQARKPVPLPPVYAPPATQPSLYLLHGTLWRYVPRAGLVDGSITTWVTTTSANAAFARFTTLTFRITATTAVQMDEDGVITDGESGWVQIRNLVRADSLQSLQALPASAVIDDRQPEHPQPAAP